MIRLLDKHDIYHIEIFIIDRINKLLNYKENPRKLKKWIKG